MTDTYSFDKQFNDLLENNLQDNERRLQWCMRDEIRKMKGLDTSNPDTNCITWTFQNNARFKKSHLAWFCVENISKCCKVQVKERLCEEKKLKV